MGIKSFIPGTVAYSEKHHVKYLRKKAGGHDVLLLVEWADGTMTELGADYHPEKDGWYVATNGLVFANVGEGVDPVSYYGVSVVRCHAEIGCPFSTEACIQSEYDEAGEFDYVNQNGKTIKIQEKRPIDPSPNGNGANGNGKAVADGGGQQVEREYDIRPPAESVGHTFGLTQAKQRAPNAISSRDLRKAIEIGKQSERDTGKFLKYIAYGAGGVLAIVLILFGFLWLLGQVGGSGDGGGGTLMPGMLLLVPATRSVRHRVATATDDISDYVPGW